MHITAPTTSVSVWDNKGISLFAPATGMELLNFYIVKQSPVNDHKNCTFLKIHSHNGIVYYVINSRVDTKALLFFLRVKHSKNSVQLRQQLRDVTIPVIIDILLENVL